MSKNKLAIGGISFFLVMEILGIFLPLGFCQPSGSLLLLSCNYEIPEFSTLLDIVFHVNLILILLGFITALLQAISKQFNKFFATLTLTIGFILYQPVFLLINMMGKKALGDWVVGVFFISSLILLSIGFRNTAHFGLMARRYKSA